LPAAENDKKWLLASIFETLIIMINMINMI